MRESGGGWKGRGSWCALVDGVGMLRKEAAGAGAVSVA